FLVLYLRDLLQLKNTFSLLHEQSFYTYILNGLVHNRLHVESIVIVVRHQVVVILHGCMACPSHSRSIPPCPLHFSINVLYSKLSDNTTGQKSTISHFASVLFDNCDSFVIRSYPCPGPSDLFSKISFD